MKLKIVFMPLLVIASLLFSLHAAEPVMTVYKTPTCGCCQKWVDHMSDNNVATEVVSLADLSSIKAKYAIAGRYRSCHTGIVVTDSGDYVFEGHVPAEYVKAFLANPPQDAIGLSVPGMPLGSPGMEVGDRKDYYQVLVLKTDGSSTIYAHVNQKNM
ncbi:MAG: hypothetical protein ACJA2E_001911 [Arenicella sp.]|jgi:hypothetical protein